MVGHQQKRRMCEGLPLITQKHNRDEVPPRSEPKS